MTRVGSLAGPSRSLLPQAFRRATLIAFVCACAWSVVAHAEILGERSDVAVRFDPDKPDRKTAPLWLSYLLARATYHSEQNLPSPMTGEIVPTFAEEVYGRRAAIQVYRELKPKDPKIRNVYWETMSNVEASGMLDSYVWSFHRRDVWPASAKPQAQAAFEAWRRANLRQHRPQTFGSLEANRG